MPQVIGSRLGGGGMGEGEGGQVGISQDVIVKISYSLDPVM